MGEPLSPDRVFDFPIDEPEPHLAYDFFAPGSLPGYAGNPNNNNGWIEADVPLLGELGEMGEPQGAEVDEPMVIPAIEEVAEPIDEAEEQMIAPVVDMDEDIAMLFGDDDFEDDASEGFDEEESVYEVGGPSTAAVEGPSFPLPSPGLPLVKKVIQVSDAEVAAGVTIREIGPRVFDIKGQGQQTATQRDEEIARLTQQVQALQVTVQQRDTQIQQLQTMVSEMSSHEGTLMQCILGMDKRLVDLERIPPGPQ
ncbi:hypothetical protein Tco_0699661 [Tanacetum coccineum]